MIMKKIFALLVISMVLLACTDETNARHALESQGFTDVKMTGYVYGACSDDDDTHTGFTAKNPQGHPVSGVVCCGYFLKNCTIRW